MTWLLWFTLDFHLFNLHLPSPVPEVVMGASLVVCMNVPVLLGELRVRQMSSYFLRDMLFLHSGLPFFKINDAWYFGYWK